MKKCPFCAEEIQDEAVKCRFCGEFLDKMGQPKTKWYFTTSSIVITLLCLPPLAFPMVWFNPRYKTTTRLVVTFLVIVPLTILFFLSFYLIGRIYHNLIEQMKALGMH